MSVAIQFTQNFLGAEPECGQVCKFVKEFRPDLLGVCTAGIEVPCKLLNLSLSTFIRRAIHNVKIEKIIIVAGGGEETLTAVSTLLAQCSKVGSNLNQLARHFNSGGADTEQIRAKLLDELADLTAFRLSAEKVLGELYGNAQAYRL